MRTLSVHISGMHKYEVHIYRNCIMWLTTHWLCTSWILLFWCYCEQDDYYGSLQPEQMQELQGSALYRSGLDSHVRGK